MLHVYVPVTPVFVLMLPRWLVSYVTEKMSDAFRSTSSKRSNAS
jgi:hypothetical protein